MRVFKTKSFDRFCRRSRITDASLLIAIDDVVSGSVAVGLGGEVYKLRVARPGQGKSGGYRTVVAIRMDHRALFLFGFAKADQDNLDEQDIALAKKLARDGLDAMDEDVERALLAGRWKEI